MKKIGRFSAWVAEYVDHRKQLGYRVKEAGRNLRNLADFMDREACGQPLTDAWIYRWREANIHRSPSMLNPLASFAPWLIMRDPRTSVSRMWLRRQRNPRPTPYIYDPEEIIALINATGRLKKYGHGFRVHTYATILGLLASTGLRIGEALRLDRNDVDLHDAVLRVRESKDVPLRMVPFHESTADALRRYAEICNQHHSGSKSEAFFVGSFGRRLHHGVFGGAFRALRNKAGVPFHPHPRPPRIHDLRHTFATRHLLRVRREGGDMHCAVADLSVYLGHSSVENTYWYLTGIPELMALGGERFRVYVEARRKEGRP